jgi:hypothetical protein
MKISESTEFKIDLKTVIGIIMLTTTLVGMYYTLQDDIQLAKTLPPVQIERLEYDLKEQWNKQNIDELIERVDMLEEANDILKEEVKITSSMLKDGTKADDKFEELNRQLEELQKRKPKTTVIVKEVQVSKKGRKL